FSTAIVLFKHGRKILNVFESEKANFFYELSKAFLEWDQFEYGTSLNHLKSAKEIIEKFKYEKLYEEWYNFIDKKINFLSSILNNSKLFKLFFTFDLFENALRKFRKSELKEVVLPLYRSIESLMEWRLLDKYNYARDKEINNVFPNEKLDKIIRTYKEKMQKEDIKIDYEGAKTRLLKLPIYLKEMEAILEALDDELYLEFKKYLMSEKDYVEVLRNWRNFHPLIHGGSEKKIDTKLLDKIIGQYYNFLKHQFGSKFNEYREITKLKIYNENDFLKSYIHH
ncbi:MAG: hypothetical protein OH363_04180, partial [Candidatus Parvarchaeota archaeon]|nr:hypothetical protein [Candidatus Jingweiarchaeum tengchongense]